MKLKTTQVTEARKIILEQQDGKCAICGMIPLVPCLDHEHKRGFVRGVLCRTCNAGEGRVKSVLTRCGVKDQLNYLKGLIEYLEKHQTDQTGLIHPTFKNPNEPKKRTRKNPNLR